MRYSLNRVDCQSVYKTVIALSKGKIARLKLFSFESKKKGYYTAPDFEFCSLDPLSIPKVSNLGINN